MGHGAFVVGVGQIGCPLYRPGEVIESQPVIALLRVGNAPAVVGGHHFGVLFDSLRELLDGLRVVFRHLGRDPPVVRRLRLARVRTTGQNGKGEDQGGNHDDGPASEGEAGIG